MQAPRAMEDYTCSLVDGALAGFAAGLGPYVEPDCDDNASFEELVASMRSGRLQESVGGDTRVDKIQPDAKYSRPSPQYLQLTSQDVADCAHSPPPPPRGSASGFLRDFGLAAAATAEPVCAPAVPASGWRQLAPFPLQPESWASDEASTAAEKAQPPAAPTAAKAARRRPNPFLVVPPPPRDSTATARHRPQVGVAVVVAAGAPKPSFVAPELAPAASTVPMVPQEPASPRPLSCRPRPPAMAAAGADSFTSFRLSAAVPRTPRRRHPVKGALDPIVSPLASAQVSAIALDLGDEARPCRASSSLPPAPVAYSSCDTRMFGGKAKLSARFRLPSVEQKQPLQTMVPFVLSPRADSPHCQRPLAAAGSAVQQGRFGVGALNAREQLAAAW